MTTGESSVVRMTRAMWDSAIPSRSASSAMVVNSPDSSTRFQRKARASALINVLSILRWLDAPPGNCIGLHEAKRNVHGHRMVTVDAFATTRRAQRFPRAAAVKMSLSRVRSNTAPLRRRFSFSSSLRLFNCLRPMPPQSLPHR